MCLRRDAIWRRLNNERGARLNFLEDLRLNPSPSIDTVVKLTEEKRLEFVIALRKIRYLTEWRNTQTRIITDRQRRNYNVLHPTWELYTGSWRSQRWWDIWIGLSFFFHLIAMFFEYHPRGHLEPPWFMANISQTTALFICMCMFACGTRLDGSFRDILLKKVYF